jgi:hypothetical protein
MQLEHNGLLLTGATRCRNLSPENHGSRHCGYGYGYGYERVYFTYTAVTVTVTVTLTTWMLVNLAVISVSSFTKLPEVDQQRLY